VLVVARYPRCSSELADERKQPAVLVIGRAEIAQADMRLGGEALLQRCGDARLAETGFAGDQPLPRAHRRNSRSISSPWPTSRVSANPRNASNRLVNVALPQIGISLGTSVEGLQWTVDGYFLVFAVLLLSAGVLSDRLGARRAFVSGFAVFSVASLACTLAPSPAALIGARAVQGGGAALLVPCSLALLNNACGNDAGVRARAIGIWTGVGAVGSAAGPVLGGLLVGFIGWRSIFLVNLPIGLIGIWLTLRFIHQTTNRSQLRQG
jgi:hypothetical protein